METIPKSEIVWIFEGMTQSTQEVIRREIGELLQNKVITFWYVTEKGEIKERVGTLNANLVPKLWNRQLVELESILETCTIGGEGSQALADFIKENKPKTYTAQENPTHVNYYDFTAGGWRKFKIENLKGYVKLY